MARDGEAMDGTEFDLGFVRVTRSLGRHTRSLPVLRGQWLPVSRCRCHCHCPP